MLSATTLAQVVSQLIAFLLFFWILQRYAWGPVNSFLKDRQRRIDEQIAEGQRRLEEGERHKAEYEQKLREIDLEARNRLNAAVAEAQQLREDILNRAQRESRAVFDKQKQLVEFEVAKARIAIRDEVVNMVIGASERLLAERLDDAKHRELVKSFLGEIEGREPGG